MRDDRDVDYSMYQASEYIQPQADSIVPRPRRTFAFPVLQKYDVLSVH